MRIVFVKKYVDMETYAQYVDIDVGYEAELLDEVTGRVMLTEGYEFPLEIEYVPASVYVPKRTDVE